jgi:hypothetical protein
MKRLSSEPQEAVTESGSGPVPVPVAPLDTSGGVVPCQVLDEILIAMASYRSLMLLLTVRVEVASVAIR